MSAHSIYIDGDKYHSVLSNPSTCKGCIADNDCKLCTDISTLADCVDVIWLKSESANPETSNKETKMPTSQDIHTVLAERGTRYGSFETQAQIAQELKATMKATGNWTEELDPDMQESLEMIQHKIARILNGDPHYKDSWTDIAGYATLIADRLKD